VEVEALGDVVGGESVQEVLLVGEDQERDTGELVLEGERGKRAKSAREGLLVGGRESRGAR